MCVRLLYIYPFFVAKPAKDPACSVRTPLLFGIDPVSISRLPVYFFPQEEDAMPWDEQITRECGKPKQICKLLSDHLKK